MTVAIVCIVGVLGLALVGRIINERAIARTPLHTVASAPNSTCVRIIGIALPIPNRAPLIAPFSGTPCLGYEVEVKYSANRKNVTDTRWAVSPLIVVDDTGQALLSTDAAMPRTFGGRTTVSKGFISLGMTAHDNAALLTLFGRERVDQIAERVLLPNDRITIYAYAVRDSVAAPGQDYRTGSREQLYLTKPPAGALYFINVEPPPPPR